jgi:heme-degrading monooxygenase HmoA
MITRLWRGVTRAADADAYAAYLESTGVAECRAVPGNRGVLVLRRMRREHCEFRFLSFWDSFEAIRAFAGPEPQVARYYPEDARYLLALSPRVHHFEVTAAEWGAVADFAK